MTERICQIYELLDPDGAIRYVGYTSQTKESRLKWHIRCAEKGRQEHVYRWIRSIAPAHPTPRLICEVPESLVDETERYWIARRRAEGHKLTNMAPGGKGHLGYKQRPESIAKRAAALKGRPCADTTRAGISLGNHGKRRTDEARAKMSAAKRGKTWSPAQRAALEKVRPKSEPAPNPDPQYCDLCESGPFRGVRGVVRHKEHKHKIFSRGAQYGSNDQYVRNPRRKRQPQRESGDCTFCGRTFSSPASASNHERKMHPSQLSPLRLSEETSHAT